MSHGHFFSSFPVVFSPHKNVYSDFFFFIFFRTIFFILCYFCIHHPLYSVFYDVVAPFLVMSTALLNHGIITVTSFMTYCFPARFPTLSMILITHGHDDLARMTFGLIECIVLREDPVPNRARWVFLR